MYPWKFSAIMVNFSQSNYSASESDELVQPVLVLSNPSSSDITIRVDTINREATGEGLVYLTSRYHTDPQKVNV